MKRTLFILAASLLLGACSHKQQPEDIIDVDRMAAFLADAYTLESYNSIESKSDNDTLSLAVRSAYDDILRRHGLTQKEVEKSLDYYGNHPDQYRVVLDEVANRLNEVPEI